MATSDVLQSMLEYLNDDDSVCYALSFNPTLKAWNVLKLTRIETDRGERYGKHVVSPFANNHASLVAAMKDAITLKAGGH